MATTMRVQQMIEQIRAAKRSHKAWVQRAEALVRGIAVEKEHIPLFSTDCEFGKWYYGAGQALRSLDSFRAIEPVHDELHRIYMDIFRLLFEEETEDPSWLDRLLGRSAKKKEENLKKARELLLPLQAASEEIVSLLDRLERDLQRRFIQQQKSKD